EKSAAPLPLYDSAHILTLTATRHSCHFTPLKPRRGKLRRGSGSSRNRLHVLEMANRAVAASGNVERQFDTHEGDAQEILATSVWQFHRLRPRVAPTGMLLSVA